MVKCCFEQGLICNKRDCGFFICDIRFNNCAKQVNKEMTEDEISFVTGMGKNEIQEIINTALKKIYRKIYQDEISNLQNKIKKIDLNFKNVL